MTSSPLQLISGEMSGEFMGAVQGNIRRALFVSKVFIFDGECPFLGDRRENVLGALFGEVFWGVNFFHKGNVRGTVTA